MGVIRILLLADTHLGFDEPQRPRVQRRRRGPDFFRNFQRALEPAMAGDVDVVVHGGDLLYRSRVPPSLVERALAPLKRVADRGVPVLLVPGNHERSHIPYPLLAVHPGLFIFDRPRTVTLQLRGQHVAFGGFPYAQGVRDRFRPLLAETRLLEHEAGLRFVCVHHCVEGATVGPNDFVFRHGADVIRARELPRSVTAVLSGHIHRHQILRAPTRYPVPVLYPGSVERTSFAERDEQKGFLLLDARPDASGGTIARARFVPLETRPMLEAELVGDAGSDAVRRQLQCIRRTTPVDAILRLRVRGPPDADAARLLSATALRLHFPASMNVSVAGQRQRTTQGSA